MNINVNLHKIALRIKYVNIKYVKVGNCYFLMK